MLWLSNFGTRLFVDSEIYNIRMGPIFVCLWTYITVNGTNTYSLVSSTSAPKLTLIYGSLAHQLLAIFTLLQ